MYQRSAPRPMPRTPEPIRPLLMLGGNDLMPYGDVVPQPDGVTGPKPTSACSAAATSFRCALLADDTTCPGPPRGRRRVIRRRMHMTPVPDCDRE